MLKRLLDIVIASSALVLLSPVYAFVTYKVRKNLGSPVLFRQVRPGLKGKPFEMIKFRSMGAKYGSKDAAEEFREMGREDLAEEYEKNRKVENDPRITRFGRFLRATSIDELPQIFNVLKGDISLVGPRPILPQETKLAKGRTSLLHSVKSGMTGLWQVSGRSELSFDERIELELFYAQNWTFWLDIKILFKTVWVVLKGRGAK